MKKICFLFLIVPIILLGQDESESSIVNVTHIDVKMGHRAQFTEGVEKYKKCYADNGGTNKWNFWQRLQGNSTTYAVTDVMKSWAEMDDDNDEAANKCRTIFIDFIMPHMENVDYMISETMPDISNNSQTPRDKYWVTYFSVNNSAKFMDVIKSVTKEVKKAEGDERGYWYAFMGGSPKAPNYMVAWPFDKYADLDEDMDSVWEIYKKAMGEKKTKEMRAKFNAAIDDSWSYIYDKSETMSKTK